MIVLAVDSAGDKLKMGLADERNVICAIDSTEERNHSESIVTSLDTLLASAKIDSSEIGMLAVASGPGSFTGLRVGIAAVLGLSQAWNKNILTASNPFLEKTYFAQKGKNPLIVIPCRGNEFYVSEDGVEVLVLTVEQIVDRYPDSSIGGIGTSKLKALLTDRKERIKFLEPSSYSGGELALIFAQNHKVLTRLDPANLDVNYLLKSQPEVRRDSAQQSWGILEMTQADIGQILTIEKDSFTDPWDRESFISDIENDHVITLVAKSGEKCLGYLCCIALDDYGYIANIAVELGARSTGVGRGLMAELRRRLIAKQIYDIVLDVRTTNQQALKFYEKQGFAIITRRKGFYSHPPEDSFTMQLTIGD